MGAAPDEPFLLEGLGDPRHRRGPDALRIGERTQRQRTREHDDRESRETGGAEAALPILFSHPSKEMYGR
jgi:hypothetical protein